ncbi:eukaryotic cytochrome b561-domain-containing protein [Halteromyces radiatus]|uniref:eukaryotic cytochrome b561-domain-containing protein n=1 Tax=Halteromyces radiatus TaxID=101107 RepID=UPI00221F9B64|nr:eukaryotic cytochrome b561-domain-containing protein [Halteromyces radiatus]KAI8089723.1 eukaryotic cytochrome b561-domain-containing protein [Halteromyces radiatus]
MILFIITMTEGIVTLQLTQTKQEKRQGLGRHAILQLSAFFSAIIGFSAIFYNKVLLNKDHFISGHGKLGILVLSYLLLQVIFGIFCASTPHRLALPIKKLWKYHRITGYIFFILVWVTAVFGIQTDYMITNSWIIPSRYLSSNWIFLFVVIANVGILLRLRFYKLKGQVTLGDHPPSSSPSSSSL